MGPVTIRTDLVVKGDTGSRKARELTIGNPRKNIQAAVTAGTKGPGQRHAG